MSRHKKAKGSDRLSLDELSDQLKIKKCRYFELKGVLIVQCADSSECGRVWRRFDALDPQGWHITLYFGVSSEYYGSTQPLPPQDPESR